MEYTERDRLAIAQGLFKVLADTVSTKDPDSLRSRADRDMLANYESMGVKSIDLNINGQKVGTYSVRVSKPKSTAYVSVTDETAYTDWALENGLGRYVVDEQAVVQHCQLTGEVPDGATVQVREDPARPTGTTLKVDPQAVARAVKGDLPDMVRGLLEGEVA